MNSAQMYWYAHMGKNESMWWFGSVFLIALAAMAFSYSWWSAIPLLIMGAMISPPAFISILAKIKLRDRIHVRMLLVLVTLVGSTYLMNVHSDIIRHRQEKEVQVARYEAFKQEKIAREAREKARLETITAEFAANREKILGDLETAISAKNVSQAKSLFDRYQADVKDKELLILGAKYKEMSAEIQRESQIEALVKQSKTLKVDQYAEAISIYKELAALDPQNVSYKKNLDRFTKAKADSEERTRKAEAAAAAAAQREKKIESQFSAWDGSHRTFERMIKNAMNDPDSYDHVKTQYKDLDSKIRVYATFRGKNGFGGMVVNTKVADFDLDGNFLREVE